MSACEIAKAAIDDAFHDGVKQAFVVLHLNLIDNVSTARPKFDAALEKLRETYDMAGCAAAEVLEK